MWSDTSFKGHDNFKRLQDFHGNFNNRSKFERKERGFINELLPVYGFSSIFGSPSQTEIKIFSYVLLLKKGGILVGTKGLQIDIEL